MIRCPLNPPSPVWTGEQNTIIMNVLVFLNSVSLVLGTITVLLLVLFKKKFTKTLSFYYCAVTTITHFGLLLGPMVGMDVLRKHNSLACAIQGAVLQFFVFSSVCWFLWLSIQLYASIVLEQNKTYLMGAHIFSWGFPLFITMLDLALPGMVFREIWCWVPNCNNGLFEWLFYGPTLVIVFIVACLWIRSLGKVLQFSSRPETRAFMIQNLVGVFILFISYTFQAAHRIYLLKGDATFTLELIHLISMSWLGIVCFFVFGITNHNLETIKAKFYAIL